MEQNDRHEKSVDLDVTPEGPYADQRPYPPKKKPGYGPVWIGIAAVAVIIIVTLFAFSGDKEADRAAETPVAVPPATETTSPDLPEKAPGAVSFSPSPEMRAAEEADDSQNMVAATSAPVPDADVDQTLAEEQKAAEQKAAEQKAAEKKAAEKRAAERKAAEKKAAEAKAAEAKAAEAKAAEAKAAEAKAAEAKAAEAKPAEEAKASETNTAETKSAEAKPDADSAADSKPAEPADTKTAEVKNEGAKVEEAQPAESAAISDQWVVNVSSTPDAAESLRVLSQVMSRKAAGENIYAYETTINGVAHHRIRIGFFATRAEAEAVGQRVKEELKLSATPWAVQPNVDEVTKYKK